MSETTIELVYIGAVYILGLDKNYHPNLILKFSKFLNQRNNIIAIKNAILYISIIIIENMMIPKIIERMNIIMDYTNCDL